MSDEVAAQIRDAYLSPDPTRKREAFQLLKDAAADGTYIPVRPPRLTDLDNVGRVPEDLLVPFLEALWDYPFYEPPMELDEIYRTSLNAVLRHGDHYSAFLFALRLQTSPLPDIATQIVVEGLAGQELPDGSRAQRTARQLVDFLLDSGSTRDAAIAALAKARRGNRLRELVDYFRPAFTEEEWARLSG